MKASELVALLQKKIERHGDWDVLANNHPVNGVRAIKLTSKMLFMIDFDSFCHDTYR